MQYHIVPIGDNIHGRRLYIPQPSRTNPLDLNDISRRISDVCTVTRADIMAVLTALEDVIAASLLQGHTLRLDALGCFHLRMRATPAESPDDVDASNIRNISVAYVPSRYLKQRLAEAHFERE